jgi:hypothetical protein
MVAAFQNDKRRASLTQAKVQAAKYKTWKEKGATKAKKVSAVEEESAATAKSAPEDPVREGMAREVENKGKGKAKGKAKAKDAPDVASEVDEVGSDEQRGKRGLADERGKRQEDVGEAKSKRKEVEKGEEERTKKRSEERSPPAGPEGLADKGKVKPAKKQSKGLVHKPGGRMTPDNSIPGAGGKSTKERDPAGGDGCTSQSLSWRSPRMKW